MMPVLLVSKDKKFISQYIDTCVKTYGIHPSGIFHVHPTNTVITIDQVRDIQSAVMRAHGDTLIVLHDFGTAKNETQNAFLKTLEEGIERTHVIMLVADETQVLPTIQSRSIVVWDTSIKHTVKPEISKKFDACFRVPTYEAWLGETSRLKKEDAVNLLDSILLHLQKKLRTSDNPGEISLALQSCIEARKYISKNNVNYEYALDTVGLILSDNKQLPLTH